MLSKICFRFEQKTEMAFDRTRSKQYWSSSSRFILSLLSKFDEKGPAWNHGSQSNLNPFSPIVRFLATPQRLIIASPDA